MITFDYCSPLHLASRVGPAVFNGGLSTLLAFILLSTSRSYVFLSFFKIFLLICVFGLFHGLVVLPVLLSSLGPASRHSGEQGQGEGQEMKERKGEDTGEDDGVAETLLETKSTLQDQA